MATAAEFDRAGEQRERRFFFAMAIAVALTVVPAFWVFFRAGFASFSAPWWAHVHAVTFMGWLGIFVVQSGLALKGNIALHKKLGMLAAGYAAWMVLVGLVLTPVTLAAGRIPPFFTGPYFLALDWLNIVIFAVLIGFGIRMRKQTDWHRRLILCATVCVIAPAWGRWIVLSGFEMTAWSNIVPLMGYIVVAAIADLIMHGKVHRAYFWGAGGLLVFGAGTGLLAQIPPFISLAESIAG